MPSFKVIAPAFAQLISSVCTRSAIDACGISPSSNSLKRFARAFNRFPRSTSASFALLATLVAPIATAGTTANAPRVLLNTTQGEIILELDEERAPQSVKNFLEYVDSGYYSDTLFHRVIEGFMIQGGGFDRNYKKKTTRAPVSNEAYNGLRNRHYTIAMARTTAPHSATSQFFINSADNSNLDHTNTTQRGWGYTVFGRVVEGQDIVDAISRVRTGPGGPFSRDVPSEPVVILSATRVLQVPDAAAATQAGNNVAVEPVSSSVTEQQPAMKSENRSRQDPVQPIEQN